MHPNLDDDLQNSLHDSLHNDLQDSLHDALRDTLHENLPNGTAVLESDCRLGTILSSESDTDVGGSKSNKSKLSRQTSKGRNKEKPKGLLK